MDMSEYLKNILNPLLSPITNAIAMLAQQNAMNVAYSDSEIAEMARKEDEIRENLDKIYQSAKKEVEKYRQSYEEWASRNQELIEEQNRLYAAMDESRKKYDQLNGSIAETETRRAALERDAKEAQRRIEALRKEEKEAIRKKEKKDKELKKWFWVPGYGLYLAIDNLLYDVQDKIRIAEEQINRLNGEISGLDAQIQNARQETEELQRKTEALKAEEEANKNEQQKVAQKLFDAKQELVRWEDLQQQLGNLQAKLETGKNSPDVIMEILDILESIGGAA